ncbi:MAG: TauD/TfdA family dioxygenase [Rhodospirillaceae bacterium]|jgi:taurine dioxygenase|nr:TauD/TfdA family dioxygenase [Rhodospirillaceae bacterium]MBT4490806.1 TauD/TfdA family dioxygenase [Rhodospirillaceae bacterium]MBT5191557.1 TauD/TfdA family dioxygenase [Rhodospirillaceae bacterium]MBT5894685.1 TauD/TfdA family dioxygenase [Rhodospirillaceae bacterium]MBT6429627.1 TauD/TfdA family dioxygenase [Rhodospirillaceae bacterium]
MQITPINDAIGARVEGVDLAAGIDDGSFAAIHKAWLDNCMLLFRGQTLTPTQLTAFAARFGPLEPPPGSEKDLRADSGSDADKDMWIISNVIENGKPIGALGDGEAEWHSDMTYLDMPPTASVLYGHEVPPVGANTWFANMYRAWDQMPASLAGEIESRQALHNSSYTSAGELRKGMDEVTDVRDAPGAVHPIVIDHPDTERQALFLGRRTNAYIKDMELADSEALLDRLWDYCVGGDFTYTHEWERGDVLIWDNRSTLHRRDAFDPSHRRILWRCQISGTALPSVHAA